MDKVEKKRKGWLGWLKEAVICIVIIVIVGLSVDLWRSQSMASGKSPELISQSIYGDEVDLVAMSQDKPVMVYFWATWCAVCGSVSPSVNFVENNKWIGDYSVVTVALSSGEQKILKQYMNAKEYSFTVVNDPKGEVSSTWGASVTPTIFVINKGEITSVATGFTSPIGMWLRLLFS